MPGQPHQKMCVELFAACEEFRKDAVSGEGLRKEVFRTWAQDHYGSGVFCGQSSRSGAGFLAAQMSVFGFYEGAMILETSFLTLKRGWKELNERVEFRSDPPTRPSRQVGIRSWEEYISYRQLSASSIAPLMLPNVLTVYHMLRHCMKITQPAGSLLTVHMLGPEGDLNYIPLFPELAYLLPGIDLRLVMISPYIKRIWGEARKMQGKRILKNATDGMIFDFHAPALAGGGRDRVQLNVSRENFAYFPEKAALPNAGIALNAGLASTSYPAWAPAIVQTFRRQVPLAFSDQSVTQYICNHPFLPRIASLHCGMDSPVLVAPPFTNILNPLHGFVSRDARALAIHNINNGYIMHSKAK